MNVKSPNFWQSILLFAILAAIHFTLQIILYLLLNSIITKDSVDLLLVSTICSIIAFSVVIAVAVTWFETNLYAYLESAPVRLKIVIPLTLMFIGLQIATSEFDNLIRYLIKPADSWTEQIHKTLTGSNPVILFISIVIVMPFFEELFFRGILLRGMLKNHSPKLALISSALMFGVLHFNPVLILTTSVIGLFLGWIFIITGSLWCCFFCHAINNLVVFVSVILNLELAGYANFKSLSPEVSFQPLWLDALGLLLLITGTYFTKRTLKEYRSSSLPAPKNHQTMSDNNDSKKNLDNPD